MLTLSHQTATEVGSNYADEDDERWRGAARKYLATVADRTYLVKPDIGWPSNRDHERVAAAFYRSLGQPVPNVVNATIGGTDACAVRILPNAYPIGDEFASISLSAAKDVFRGLILSSLIGDRDRHQYNWIHDGRRAYAIDHGLAFADMSYGPRIPSFATEYVYDMLDAGVLSLGDMAVIAATLPERATRMAAIAWAHVGKAYNAPYLPDDVRAYAQAYVAAITTDYAGARRLTYDNWSVDYDPDMSDPDDDPCDCEDCIGQVTDDAEPMTGDDTARRAAAGEMVWNVDHWTTPIPNRNRMACGFDAPAYAAIPHRHSWSVIRGWHSTGYANKCKCSGCIAPQGRQAGKRCISGKVFPRKVSDIYNRVRV